MSDAYSASASPGSLRPATVRLVDGVPYADAFGDIYHSVDGGLAQARHVFIGGNRLPERWRQRERFVILETGFGLGLNFLATWQAWQGDPERPARLHYVAVEKHPFTAPDLARLHATWPELAALSAQLIEAWPLLLPGFHRLSLEGGQITLTLIFGDVAHYLPRLDAHVDAFYLDGFSPGKNPEMWEPRLLERLNRLAAPEATLATYTVSSQVRQALSQGGFVCEKLPGFGRKRDMLAGHFAPRWSAVARRTVTAGERRAIVIGAGLAGSAACCRLAARGWKVTLIERHPGPARETSGNLAGIVMPLISRDDNLTSRLARAAYLYSLRLWRQLGGIGVAFDGEACGVLQLAASDKEAQLQRETAERWNFPAEFAQWIDAETARALTGSARSDGGWLFPQGGWVRPASFCAALLDACGERLERRFGQSAAAFERVGSEWRVLDDHGRPVAQAPTVIVANGTNATHFAQTQCLALSSMRGQVTHVPAESLPALPVVVCGEGYLTRPSQGMVSIGASYDSDDDPMLRADSHRENLRRLALILPDAAAALGEVEGQPMAGRVGFRSIAPDRLPLAGALPDAAAASIMKGTRLRDVPRLAGLHGLLGYGSRGLIWAPFAAELLASQLEGEPLPVESELAAALDPARFLLKERRRNS